MMGLLSITQYVFKPRRKDLSHRFSRDWNMITELLMMAHQTFQPISFNNPFLIVRFFTHDLDYDKVNSSIARISKKAKGCQESSSS